MKLHIWFMSPLFSLKNYDRNLFCLKNFNHQKQLKFVTQGFLKEIIDLDRMCATWV